MLRMEPESANDVYEFDQRDASHTSSANLQSAGLTAKFRPPERIKRGAITSRKCVKNKMLYVSNAVIEAGKTSTPCPVTGHQKTKKKMPGTPVPWVELPHLHQNSLGAYAVSPIAVEHDSPNDLSRLSVNSMFDDMADFIPPRKSDEASSGSNQNNKMSGKLPSSTQCVIKDISGKLDGSEKHKSDADSGYPRSDSQSEFMSLSAGVSQDAVDSGSQAQIEMLETSTENTPADSDCEVVSYKRGTLDPAMFNSAHARGYSKVTSKRHRVNDDVEPSSSSSDSDVGICSDIKSKSSVRGKPSQSVEGATAVYRESSQVLRTRNSAMDSKTTSGSSDHYKPSRKVWRKASRKMESTEMPSDVYLYDTTPSYADVKMHAKAKSRRKPAKKQTTEGCSSKQTENVRVAGATDVLHTNGAGLEDGDAEGKHFIPSYHYRPTCYTFCLHVRHKINILLQHLIISHNKLLLMVCLYCAIDVANIRKPEIAAVACG